MNLEVPFYGARRLNATIPMAQLRVSENGLWLGTSTITIPKDRRSVEYRSGEIAEVFPSTGLLTRGVGIVTYDGKTHYFWTLRPARVLKALADSGYSIRTARRPPSLLFDQLPIPWRRHRSQ
jgi:hypothetical protein